jgi:CRISPR-associated endonuclease/helicase Cas3
MMDISFDNAFRDLTGNNPFPWQQDLYKRFISNRFDNIPTSCNLPTGLGKTSVIAIWLIALANHPTIMPRRLVYVVNRRTVVDQTTDEVEKLRDNLLNRLELAELKNRFGSPAISTLRGQFADNREWSADPSRPAVICGTVDMIGSRLLFSGYGVGFKGKPLHAGFLGQDVLLVHDEAHLEPAFQTLLIAIENEQKRSKEYRPLRVMELSATSRAEEDKGVFTLTPEEKNPDFKRTDASESLRTVWKRIMAKKGTHFYGVERSELANKIGRIALRHKEFGKAVLVFVRTIEDVKTIQGILTDKKDGVPANQVQMLTGTLRGLERDRLAKGDPVFDRFLLKTPSDGKTVYLVCTSAGEVGIDISADHMVCDLTPYDSMAQRLGRVNRRGEGSAEIDVVYENDPDPKKKGDGLEKSRWQTLDVLKGLPASTWISGRYEASPHELGRLMAKLTEDDRKAAFSPSPIVLPTSDILFDAWALTTIREKLPGRPPVADYLHGVCDWEPPQTVVAWRTEVSEITGELLGRYEPRELLESYPLKAHELLRDRTDRVFNVLKKLAAVPETPVWVLDEEDDVVITSLGEILDGDKEALDSKTVLLPPQAGGLGNGFLEANAKYDSARTDYDVADEWQDNTGYLRSRKWNDDTRPAKMKRVCEINFLNSEDEDAQPIKIWYWFERPATAEAEAKSTNEYDLQPHLDDAKDAAENFVSKMIPEADLRSAIILAAQFHDLGKDRKRWQNGIGNGDYPMQIWAKSGNRRATAERSSYRHEFGSLFDVANQEDFKELNDKPDFQDLVMHLIAAHHGRARPYFNKDETFDHNYSDDKALSLAAEVPRRFARLQRKYGRWGLAYLESLVRAADIKASRKAEGSDS